MTRARSLLLLATAVLSACTAADSLEPAATVLADDGLRVTLTIEPKAIVAPGKAIARLTYENTGTEPVVLTSGASCLSDAAVYRGSKRIRFPSTEYACATVVTHRRMQPGGKFSVEWPLVVGGEQGIEVPAGTYRFIAMTNTGHGNLDATFVVR